VDLFEENAVLKYKMATCCHDGCKK